MSRRIYVAIAIGEKKEGFVGCKDKDLIEKFIASHSEPQYIIIVRTVVKTSIETTVINTPNVNTTNVSSIIEDAIGPELRNGAKDRELGIPILTRKNFDGFSGFRKTESRRATVIKDSRRGHIAIG